MPGVKLSVFMMVKNEEKNIGRCLESASWADEIIIVDSSSKDRTVDICRKYTDKIYQREYRGSEDMKNFALSKVSNEWALNIDADEEVTPELKDEIKRILNKPDIRINGFFIKRKSKIFGRWFKFCGTQDDFQLRLFKKSNAHYVQPIHEKVVLSGVSSRLHNVLLHYTYEDIEQYIERLNRYTTLEANFLLSERKHALLLSLIIKPPAQFIRLYIAKAGFRDGFAGFLFSCFSSFYVFIKYAKLLGYKRTIKG